MNRIKVTTDCRKVLTFLFLFAVILAFSSGTVMAQQDDENEDWTTVGSASYYPDESNPGFETLDQNNLQVTSGQPVGQNYVFRYNVTATDGLFGLGANTVLQVRYLDPGSGSRVFAVLKSVNIATGAVATLATFDSDAPPFPASAAFQTQQITVPRINFTFATNAYWLEVTIVRVNDTDTGGFGAARIGQQ